MIDIISALGIESEILYFFSSIIIGYIVRVFIKMRGTWDTFEIASKKTLKIILLMIIISIASEIEFIKMPDELNNVINIGTMGAYYMIAIKESLNSTDLSENTVLSFCKFTLILIWGLSNTVIGIIISIVTIIISIKVFCMKIITLEEEKVKLFEILLYGVENLFIFVFVIALMKNIDVFSKILLIVFEETVLYSVNWIAIDFYERHCYRLQ